METTTKVHELARKLLELVRRGVGGEAANADQMLQRMMRKHGIRIEDIDDDSRLRRTFHFKSKEQKTFTLQCIASVIGSKGHYTTARGVRGELYVDLTTAEHLECAIRVDHYWRLWVKEREAFYDAYIQANKLFAKFDPEGTEREQPMSAEELEKLRRTLELMGSAKVLSPQRMLERPEKLTA